MMAGMERRKEKVPAVLRSSPKSSPAAMVEPEREMPGMMASPWTTPMARAMPRLKPLIPRPFASAPRVSQSSTPVATRITPVTISIPPASGERGEELVGRRSGARCR